MGVELNEEKQQRWRRERFGEEKKGWRLRSRSFTVLKGSDGTSG